jgi:hypothetical protein
LNVARNADDVVVHLELEEATLVRELVRQMRLLLLGEGDDPILGRLFPDAYETAEDQQAYRELVGDTLEQQKIARFDELARALGPSGSAAPALEADVWLSTLTDMRLALGTRLGVDEQRMAAPIDPSDPQAGMLSVLHWLGWVQEEILQALTT